MVLGSVWNAVWPTNYHRSNWSGDWELSCFARRQLGQPRQLRAVRQSFRLRPIAQQR
jgi:hypothetical protein